MSVEKSAKLGSTDPRANNFLVWIRELFTQFLQHHFSRIPPGGVDGCAWHWDPNAKVTELVILNEVPVKVEALNKHPGLVLVRSPVNFTHLGMDDMSSYDRSTGVQIKRMLVSGTVVINALSSNMLESEQLAWHTAQRIWAERDMLQRSGFFDVGCGVQVGSPSPPGSLVANDQGEELFATAIALPFQVPWNTTIAPLNQEILETIDAVLVVSPTRLEEKQSAGTQGPAHAGLGIQQKAPGIPPHHVPSANNPSQDYQIRYPSAPHRRRRVPLPLAVVRLSPTYPGLRVPLKA